MFAVSPVIGGWFRTTVQDNYLCPASSLIWSFSKVVRNRDDDLLTWIWTPEMENIGPNRLSPQPPTSQSIFQEEYHKYHAVDNFLIHDVKFVENDDRINAHVIELLFAEKIAYTVCFRTPKFWKVQ